VQISCLNHHHHLSLILLLADSRWKSCQNFLCFLSLKSGSNFGTVFALVRDGGTFLSLAKLTRLIQWLQLLHNVWRILNARTDHLMKAIFSTLIIIWIIGPDEDVFNFPIIAGHLLKCLVSVCVVALKDILSFGKLLTRGSSLLNLHASSQMSMHFLKFNVLLTEITCFKTSIARSCESVVVLLLVDNDSFALEALIRSMLTVCVKVIV